MPPATKALGPPLVLRPPMGRNGQLLAMVRHHGTQDETGIAIVVGMPMVASGQLGDAGNPNSLYANIWSYRLVCVEPMCVESCVRKVVCE